MGNVFSAVIVFFDDDGVTGIEIGTFLRETFGSGVYSKGGVG